MSNRESRHIAFDLGAGSGRAIFGTIRDGLLHTRELKRFPNRPVEVSGHLHWDVFGLFARMKEALNDCARSGGGMPHSIGIDTWGVDFALLDERGELLGLPFCYRDARTRGAMEEFFARVSRERVYELTGIQLMPFNSLFQLYSMVRDGSRLVRECGDLLFMPDLFNYFLTGEKVSEFSFATTSQLYNPGRGGWEPELFEALGLSTGIMQEVVEPGTVTGVVSGDAVEDPGPGGLPVIAVASHDTASAVAAVPASGERWAYISSGTWSLMGVELDRPLISPQAMRHNFTNEGGVEGTYRFLRNIPGLWLIERCREEWSRDRPLGYAELQDMCEAAPPFAAIVDPDFHGFENPGSMPEAVREYLLATGQRPPGSRGGTARAILEGLALRYREVLERLREVSGREIESIHVVGGGSRNRPLCRFTADATGLPVSAGPSEATAVGNILVQAMALGHLASLEEIREMVRRSFTLEFYEPTGDGGWDEAYERFLAVKADYADEETQWGPQNVA